MLSGAIGAAVGSPADLTMVSFSYFFFGFLEKPEQLFKIAGEDASRWAVASRAAKELQKRIRWPLSDSARGRCS